MLAGKTDNPKEVRQLIEASYAPKLKTIDPANQEQMGSVIDLVSYWRTLVGCIKDVSPVQLRVEAEYLVKSWPEFTMQDMRIAMNLLVTQKLEMNMPYVINFSSLFMGQVISAYESYKRKEINKIGEQVTEPVLLPNDPTPAEKAEIMKEMITDCYQHVKDGCFETFYFRTVYDFLRKTNRLKITDQVAKDGKEYCEKKMKSFAATKATKIINASSVMYRNSDPKKEREDAIRKFKIEYCLVWYFENNKLESILQSITENDYNSTK